LQLKASPHKKLEDPISKNNLDVVVVHACKLNYMGSTDRRIAVRGLGKNRRPYPKKKKKTKEK
jgi:hypothetical protein